MKDQERILLVHLFSNGDCLYATAIARQIKNDFPDCHLTWMVADYCKDIIANNPHVDDTIIVKEENITSWQQYPPHIFEQLKKWEQEKVFTRIYLTQLNGDNYANYDQCIRSSVFKGYENEITVDINPVIKLTEIEKQQVDDFAIVNNLSNYKEVFLFEYAPKSGQSSLTFDKALSIATALTKKNDVAVIFASGGQLPDNKEQFISAQKLSLRQIAYLTNYCTFLLGCSSGITWACTSTISRKLHMLQILDPYAYWLNSVVNDHKRFGLPVDHIIETAEEGTDRIIECLQLYQSKGFADARSGFHTFMKLRFRMTRGIIGKFLMRGKFKLAFKHISINFKEHGFDPYFIKAVFLGFLTAPLNLFRK